MNSEGKSLRVVPSFILGVATTITLLALYHSANLYSDDTANDLRLPYGGYENVNVSLKEEPFHDLAPLLKKVGAYDRTFIMTLANWAWAEPDKLLDLFLQSFKSGEKIDHFLERLLIVAVDSQSFARCKVVHPYCYQLKVDLNFTKQQTFLSKGFLELVWARFQLQQYILEQGYNFLYSDVDILWFRSPFKHITVDADMTISYDGSIDDINSSPNTGFFYVKSSNRTIELMKYWRDARHRFPPTNEQHIFFKIKQELVDTLGVNLQSIDTKYFGCFCRFSTDIDKICTMHANCCVNGIEAKISDLRYLMDYWKNYTALSKEEKNKGLFTWRKPGKCHI